MAQVQTVLGPVGTAELGAVLAHEHIVVLNPEIQENHPGKWADGRWEEEAGIEDAVQKLRAVKQAGFDTIVDVTVVPMGRSLPRIKEISRRSGVHVIAATGLYTFDVIPPMIGTLPPDGGEDALIGLFVHDIMAGAADTGIRSGILKCATDAQGLTPGTERTLRAIAQAHRRTGVPITTHSSSAHHGGIEQQRLFLEEGVDLSRVIIGHCGDTTDIEYLEALIDAGSYIGMDRFGIDDRLPFTERVATVASMCARGHADRMVLSHDAWTFNDWFGPDVLERRPSWHYLHIPHDVLPALRSHGVTEEQIREMLVDNPRRIFEDQTTY